MKKYAITIGMGDSYKKNLTGFKELPFVYKNIADLNEKLKSADWTAYVPFLDEAASKSRIIDKINETISSIEKDDWLLVYYTGHGAKVIQPINGGYEEETYCVTYSPLLKYNFRPPLENFLTDKDYPGIVNRFHEKAPEGHLITILDCCYASGLIEGFSVQPAFHTVIAASGPNNKAYYNENSLFFQAFRRSWDLSFQAQKSRIATAMLELNAPNKCVIQTATNFSNQTL